MSTFIRVLILLAISSSTTPQATREVALGINTLANDTRKLMPLETNTFIDLISKGVFVDKTQLIESILTSTEQLTVIACPKKWGKSTNLDMVKTFISMPVHPSGARILPLSGTEQYRLFTEGKYYSDLSNITLEKPLIISNKTFASIRETYLGQYPVIHVSFADTNATATMNYTRRIGQSIARAFHEHKYMIEVYDAIIGDENKTKFEKQVTQNKKKDFLLFLEDKANDEGDYLENLDRSIYFLSEELHYIFKKKVFILVDEFDRFLHTPVSHNIQFILSNTFKNNKHLEKGIVTGILPVGWEADVVFDEFLDSKYYSFYGFTKREITLLYNFYRIPSKEQKKLAYCYNGYESRTNVAERIFNPSSTCNYMNSLVLKPYWIEVNFRDTYLHKIFELPEFQFIFSRLITGSDYDIAFLFSSFLDTNLRSLNEENALRYLVAKGYLTVENKHISEIYEPSELCLKIPNFEISTHLQTIFATKLNKLYEEELFKLLQKTSGLWEAFLRSNESTSRDLQISMEECFEYLSTYSATYIYPIDDSKALIHYMVMSIISSKRFDFVSSQFENATDDVQNHAKLKPDIVLSSRPKGRGLFVDLKHVEIDSYAVPRKRQYVDVLKKYTVLYDWNEIKFVNCTLFDNNKKIEIVASVHPIPIGWMEKSKKKTLLSYLTQLGIA